MERCCRSLPQMKRGYGTTTAGFQSRNVIRKKAIALLQLRQLPSAL